MLEQTVSWFTVLTGAGTVVAILGVGYGIITSMRKAREKYATKEYVKEKINSMEVETNLKIELIKQAAEETHSLLEYIRCRVDEIADRKPKR